MAASIQSHRSLMVNKASLFALSGPLYLFFAFFRFYFEGDFATLVITLLSLACGLAFLYLAASQTQNNRSILIVISLFSVANVVAILAGQNVAFQVLPQFLSHLGFAWALLHAKLSVRFHFYLALAVLIFFIGNIVAGIPAERVFVASRNYVSVIIILSLSFYFFACQQKGTVPSLTLLVTAMIVLLWAIGRAGILSGVLILLGTIMISGKRSTLALALLLSTAIMLFFFLPINTIPTGEFMVGIQRFERLSTGGERLFINREYFDAATLSVFPLFFGAPLETVQAIVMVNGNPHNSYISLHVSFGLLGVVLFLSILPVALWRLWRSKNFYVLLMLLVAMFRSVFDSTAFHGQMDVVIFYCIFFTMTAAKHSAGRHFGNNEARFHVKG